jgi:biopolymer transport protein ExbB
MTTRLSSAFAALTLAATFLMTPATAQDQKPASAPEASATMPAASAAPAAADQAPAPAPAAAIVSKETVDNPYGLKALWEQGDFVSKGTLMILVIMSMGSWYILITKLWESWRLGWEARSAGRSFFKSATLDDGVKTLKAGGAFHFIAQAGVEAGVHHEGSLTENIDRNTWVTMNVQRAVDTVQSRLQDGLAVLATVGSTAPFIGLFGTVWGIYHALTAIGIAGQASIDKVAGPVGEALIMTALGLAVAVPAVLGYNWLVRRNKVVMDTVRGFGTELHGVLMGAKSSR